MKAVQLTVSLDEYTALPQYVAAMNEDPELFAHQLDENTAILAAVGECGLGWMLAQLGGYFFEYEIKNLK